MSDSSSISDVPRKHSGSETTTRWPKNSPVAVMLLNKEGASPALEVKEMIRPIKAPVPHLRTVQSQMWAALTSNQTKLWAEMKQLHLSLPICCHLLVSPHEGNVISEKQ